MNKKYFLMLSVVSLLALGACKKTKVEPTPTPEPPVVTPPTVTATRQQLTLDSLFLYAKDIYYWNDKLPTYDAFNPRQYTTLGTDKTNYDKALFEITKYSNPGEYKAGATSPKFSYITDKTNKNPAASGSINNQASVDTDGNGNDVGIRFGLYGNTSNYKVYVTAVYDKSPAQIAGLARGDLIQKINGVSYETNYPGDAAINAALGVNTMLLEGTKFDGTPFNVTLTKSVFKSSHVYKSKVIEAGSKKIGYLAYARFGRLSNSASTASLADVDLDGVFNTFTAAGVSDLVIDLRYNGGGYVYAAEYLINLIAPSTATGVMFTEYYNPKMQAGNATILKNQPYLDGAGKIVQFNGRNATWDDVDFSIPGNTQSFSKKGQLNGVKNIVFLVTGNSASASELTINALKPHVNVKLVGQTTYGKPIGFFPIVLENKYEVWLSSFVTKNSLGQGDYYDGLTPDVALTTELSNVTIGGVAKTNVMFDFGNPNDPFLKSALGILAPGVVVTGTLAAPVDTKSINSLSAPSVAMANDYIEKKEFKGMIENRFKLKK